jgi:hypothetical protein
LVSPLGISTGTGSAAQAIAGIVQANKASKMRMKGQPGS